MKNNVKANEQKMELATENNKGIQGVPAGGGSKAENGSLTFIRSKVVDALDKANPEIEGDMKEALGSIVEWVVDNQNNSKATLKLARIPGVSKCDPSIDLTLADQKTGRRFVIRKDGKIKANVKI